MYSCSSHTHAHVYALNSCFNKRYVHLNLLSSELGCNCVCVCKEVCVSIDLVVQGYSVIIDCQGCIQLLYGFLCKEVYFDTGKKTEEEVYVHTFPLLHPDWLSKYYLTPISVEQTWQEKWRKNVTFDWMILRNPAVV